jgi:hypothetical protein
VDLKHIAKPPILQELMEQAEAGVVPIHIAHLQEQTFGGGVFEQCFEVSERFSGGFIEVDMAACVDTGGGCSEAVADFGFHEYCLESWLIQEFLLCHPAQSLERGLPFGCAAQIRIRFHDADDFIIG